MKVKSMRTVSTVITSSFLLFFLAVNLFSMGFANPNVFSGNKKVIQMNTIKQKVSNRDFVRHKRHYSSSFAPISKKSSKKILKLTALRLLMVHDHLSRN